MIKLTPEQYNLKMNKLLKKLKGCAVHDILIALLDFTSEVEIVGKKKEKK